MKKILVPIDFSDVGLNALKYALAAFKKDEICVLHVRTSLNRPFPSLADSEINQPNFWIKAFNGFLSKELGDSKISEKIDIKIVQGPLAKSIVEYGDENDFHVIVMGFRDKYNYFEKIFGTTSLDVVKSSNLPVYLIPKYGQHKGFSKVVVATDNNISNPSLVEKIKELNEEPNAFIKFLHIKENGDDNFKETAKELVAGLFIDKDPNFSFEISTIEDPDVGHALLGMSYNIGADLMMIAPERQNLLNTILLKSISKDLILTADIPLLFI